MSAAIQEAEVGDEIAFFVRGEGEGVEIGTEVGLAIAAARS
jgi:hypothetical protein